MRICELDGRRDQLTNMMKQYLAIKEMNPDCVIFYRLGDFYEMFFDDALDNADVLELTLTGRDCGLEERAPMCGVPYHSAKQYIAKLVKINKKVAIVEQLEKVAANSKTPIERKVVRIITPGTVIDDLCLEEDRNNFIACVYQTKTAAAVAWADISTGVLNVQAFNESKYISLLDDALFKIKPAEIIANDLAFTNQDALYTVRSRTVPEFNQTKDSAFTITNATKIIKDQFNIKDLTVFDLDKKELISCVGALINYLIDTQKHALSNIKQIKVIKNTNFLYLDLNARRNLELVESQVTRKKQGTLLGLVDLTRTGMGARKIRDIIENPLRGAKEINARLDAVEELTKNTIARETTTELFDQIGDIERICGKIAAGTVTPKDCFLLANSLSVIPKIKAAFGDMTSTLIQDAVAGMVDVSDCTSDLLAAFDKFAPVNFRDGGFIRRGYSERLDSLLDVKEYGVKWLAEFEGKERERTGIRNLKVSFSKVFGYTIEITKSNYASIPDNYILKQTLGNSQKFITQELKDAERMITSGQEDALILEMELFEGIKSRLMKMVTDILSNATSIALLDCLISFAKVSLKNNYVRPEIDESINEIMIEGGRHPVVENMLGANKFIDNDTLLDNSENNILIITGPNMGGKSTYMRQVALITIMAHAGCFVPARRARIALTDRIFTRIGASDELALGNSTFMVEMNEIANVINNATDKSLLILDEVGRGTSTFDGMSIAWAILEYISTRIKAKTLFATHYHELTALENKAVGIKNFRVLVKETNNSIIFLHKIARGSANRSFGIEVAGLAGLPDALITRAKEVLSAQEQAANSITVGEFDGVKVPEIDPNAIEIINTLKEMDMNTISPLMAFGTLQNLVDKVRK